tara:strand:- start:454 stop:627 length:174 start_codon:yes stop_codon:yes gene_type:complete
MEIIWPCQIKAVPLQGGRDGMLSREISPNIKKKTPYRITVEGIYYKGPMASDFNLRI